MRYLTALLTALFCGGLCAQSALVSPRAYLSSEGNSASLYPFFTALRYQQILTDLRGPARSLKGIGFRRDAGSGNAGHAVQRDFTLQLWCGQGDFSRRSQSFSKNYLSAPQQVFARRKLSAPDWQSAPPSQPAAFDLNIAFDQAFGYAGTRDLVWEMAVWTTTRPLQRYLCDGFSSGRTGLGSSKRLGIGCVASQQQHWMYANVILTTHRLPDRLRFFASVKRGVRSSPFVALVGLSNPQAYLPICGPQMLYTDALFSVPGQTDSLGSGNTPGALDLGWQPGLVGTKVYTQCYAPDPGQPGIPVAVSNGVESLVPALGIAPDPFAQLVSEGFPGATTGELHVGVGPVVRLQL